MRPFAAVLATTALFIALGVLLIPYCGIQMDEALFAQPFYTPPDPNFTITLYGAHVPLMVFPYIGTLKTLLYVPVFAVFSPNTYSIRVPALLIAAVAIPAFFFWCRRLLSAAQSTSAGTIANSAALIATLLFATDPSYLIGTAIDRGPVALQVLLTVLGCLLFSLRRPALGCFVFGLALWNKAIFGWTLAGLLVATLMVYRPEIRETLSAGHGITRNVTRCALAFLLGIAPLLAYNLHATNATFAPNTRFYIENLDARFIALETTLDGSNLFGYISAPATEDHVKAPVRLPSRAAAALRDVLGNHYRSLFFYATILSLFAAPLWWRTPMRKPALFAIIAFTVASAAMTVIRYTGYSHHVVLFWPLPHLLVGVAVGSLRLPWLRTAIATLLIASNLLVDNQWLVEFETLGTYTDYTDALNPLSDALTQYASAPIYMADSGATWNTRVLHQGRLNLVEAWSILNTPGDEATAQVAQMIADPRGIFVARVAARTAQVPARERLNSIARSNGYQEHILRVIQDAHGRDVFQILRFERAAP